MEKTNKKSRKKITSLLVLLAVILLCVAVVLGMGGFTYAKYISGKTVSSTTASVAKWGYVVEVNSSKLFGDMYSKTTADTTDDDGNTTVTNQTVVTYGDTTTAVGVKANTKGSLLVAPGTEGSVTFSITGSAEVRSAITIATDSTMKASDSGKFDTSATTVALAKTTGSGDSVSYSDIYEPIKWTLTKDGDTTAIADGVDYATIISKLKDLATSYGDIAPNTTENLSYTLSWAWAFEDSTNKDTYNLYDTILGAIMAYSDADGASNTFAGPNGQKIVVKSKTSAWVYENDTAESYTEYTATTSVSLGLTVSVAQIQGTKTA